MGRNRIVIVLAGVVVTVAVAVVSAIAMLLVWLDTCDGDGGYPFSEPASEAGRFCDSSYSAPYFLAEFAVPILCAAGFAVWACVRRRLGLVAAGLALSVASGIVLGAVVTLLPDICSDEQQGAEPDQCQSY